MGKEKTNTFLNSIDTEKVSLLLSSTENNVKYFNDTCNNIINIYSNELDEFMLDLKAQCIDSQNAPTQILEKYYLELANMLYFMGSKLEKLNLYTSMSNSAAKEVYSKKYLEISRNKDINGKSKITIAESSAQAELGSQYEQVVKEMYKHCENVMQRKIEAAQDMLACLKKILNGRQAELSANMFGSSSGTDKR